MKHFYRVIAIVLCILTLFNMVSCAFDSEDSSSASSSTSDIIEQVTSSIIESIESSEEEITDIEQIGTNLSLSYEDYIGDIETFVYGLLFSKLQYLYDVFPAQVQLSTGEIVSGLAYTDYTDCYTNEDETIDYVMSGFISFAGEIEVPVDEFNTGLIISNLDYQDESIVYAWKYASDPFVEHCVVYGMYLKYGVDEKGRIGYEAVPYVRGECDEEIGALYSYDESRYVYDVDFGNYLPITGLSMSETIDYAELEAEVNAILDSQDYNQYGYNVETIAHNAKEAIEGYFLSMQEETFLGCKVDDLIAAAQDLSPLECFRLTPEGISIINIEEIPPEEPTALTKWLVGSACVVLAIAGMVVSTIAIEFPLISAAAGAVTGASIQIFMEVIVENKTLKDVNWAKVGVSAVSGAVCGFIGPYMQALGGVAYFFADTAVDAVVAGVEGLVFGLIDGHSGKELAEDFGQGLLIGAAMSGGFKIVGKLAGKMFKGAGVVAEKIAPKLSKKVADIASAVKKPFQKAISSISDTLHKNLDNTFVHSRKIAKKAIERAAETMSKAQQDTLLKKHIGRGTLSLDKLTDLEGNKFATREAVTEMAKTAKKGEVFAEITLEDGKKAFLKKTEAFPYFETTFGGQTVDISAEKSYSAYKTIVKTEDGKKIVKTAAQQIREENLFLSRRAFFKRWMENPVELDEFPEMKKALKEAFPDDDLNGAMKKVLDMENPKNRLKTLFEKGKVTIHERSNGIMEAVSTELHSAISHMGGAAEEAFARQHMGQLYFEKFVESAANGTVIIGDYVYEAIKD